MLIPLLIGSVAWVGHACLLTAVLNYLYGRPLPKLFLKAWRLLTGIAILAFPPLFWFTQVQPAVDFGTREELSDWALVVRLYTAVCCLFTWAFVYVTLRRALRKTPACVVSEHTRTLDLWPELGAALIGNGKYPHVTRLPGNGVFKLDITELTLALPNLPPAWNGLTILLVSDLHFHGTPSRAYFERIIDELTAGPAPDLVCLAGDFVDSDTHYEWIRPLLGRLQANEARLAILGNHDRHHDPEHIRAELAATGYTVLSATWREITVRGVQCVVTGHEGPWFTGVPNLGAAPAGTFRLCLSHTPDNFYWGIANKINLMLCGHVHGGGVRVPPIGSIFVPSIYGRRFDQGVFEKDGTAMIVSRGVSGKEPLRIRCNPQVVRVKLIPTSAAPS